MENFNKFGQSMEKGIQKSNIREQESRGDEKNIKGTSIKKQDPPSPSQGLTPPLASLSLAKALG